MLIKNDPREDEKTMEFCRHARIFSSVDRLYILEVLEDNPTCRVTQLVMETGLSYRQVYYQLSVLRKMNYIKTVYLKGRYIVSFSSGWEKGSSMFELIRSLARNMDGKDSFEHLKENKSHLRIV